VKATAAVLVLLLSGVFSAPVTCVGWERSPSDRRQCCQRAHHQHCHDQASADTCCAAHEQGRQALSVQAPHVITAEQIAASPTPTFDTSALYQPDAVRYAVVLARRLHDPPVLLAPPLRI